MNSFTWGPFIIPLFEPHESRPMRKPPAAHKQLVRGLVMILFIYKEPEVSYYYRSQNSYRYYGLYSLYNYGI